VQRTNGPNEQSVERTTADAAGLAIRMGDASDVVASRWQQGTLPEQT